MVFLWECLTFFLLLTPSENAKKNRRISSVAMILELKMHTRNIRTHIYTRTNFQAHFDRDTEDMCARVITKLSLISCFLVFHNRSLAQEPKLIKLTKTKLILINVASKGEQTKESKGE